MIIAFGYECAHCVQRPCIHNQAEIVTLNRMDFLPFANHRIKDFYGKVTAGSSQTLCRRPQIPQGDWPQKNAKITKETACSLLLKASIFIF